MAQIIYRGNLTAKVFPFLSDHFGESVIVQGQDQNFSRQLASSEDMDKDRGIPQIYYGHNIMPSQQGFQSVGYTQVLTDTQNNIGIKWELQDNTGAIVYMAVDAAGNILILKPGNSTWTNLGTLTGVTQLSTVSTGVLNGQTYVMFANIGCWIYVASSNTMVAITFTGLTMSTIMGITSNSGYLIAYTTNSVAWSSTILDPVPTDPIDFTPSLTTGAGGGAVQQVRGTITCIVDHYLGFIIYTTENAVGAIYSGNATYPYNFREIKNCSGALNRNLIDTDPADNNHYVYGNSGLQVVTVSNAVTVMPEVTDFLGGKYFEDFNETTLTFTEQSLNSPLQKLLTTVSGRYLVLSYGVTSLTHAIVYDIVQKRYGKLKVPHVDCFVYDLQEVNQDVSRNNIGFLQANGSILTVNFNYGLTTGDGVMILGKYQYVRTRMLDLEYVELSNVRQGNTFSCYEIASLDGVNNQSPVQLYKDSASIGNYMRFPVHVVGKNHSILCMGNFYMDTIVLTFTINGKR